jgi:hypothetical protein
VRPVSRSLVEVGKCIAEVATKVSGAAVLLLEDWVFEDGCPDSAILIITSLECVVLFLCRCMAVFARHPLENGCTIREGRVVFGGEMGLEG